MLGSQALHRLDLQDTAARCLQHCVDDVQGGNTGPAHLPEDLCNAELHLHQRFWHRFPASLLLLVLFAIA